MAGVLNKNRWAKTWSGMFIWQISALDDKGQTLSTNGSDSVNGRYTRMFFLDPEETPP